MELVWIIIKLYVIAAALSGLAGGIAIALWYRHSCRTERAKETN